MGRTEFEFDAFSAARGVVAPRETEAGAFGFGVRVDTDFDVTGRLACCVVAGFAVDAPGLVVVDLPKAAVREVDDVVPVLLWLLICVDGRFDAATLDAIVSEGTGGMSGTSASSPEPGRLLFPAADCERDLGAIGLSVLKKLDRRRPLRGVGATLPMDSTVRSANDMRDFGVVGSTVEGELVLW